MYISGLKYCMKKYPILVFCMVFACLLCACGKTAPEVVNAAENETDQWIKSETSDVTGLKTGNVIRYDAFGLSVVIPDNALDNWQHNEIPSTFSELDAILEAEGAGAANWSDFEMPRGAAQFYIQILPCEEGCRDVYVMDYYMETYSARQNVELAERKVIRLGDFEWQNCFAAEQKNDTGGLDNFFVFDRIHGDYRVECCVQTFGWTGAEELAQQMFFVDVPAVEKYETSGTVGLLQNNCLRFEDYGVSINIVDEALYDTIVSLDVPQTFEQLRQSMEDDWYTIFWQDYEDDAGYYSVSAALYPSTAEISLSDVLFWDADYFKNTLNASQCGIISLPLGDSKEQKCLKTTFANENGDDENLLYFLKACGDYNLRCSISTYGWQGAEEKAKMFFSIDKPKTLPFSIDTSGLLMIDDYSVFGKNVSELRDVLGPFPSQTEFPWWGENLSYFTVECGGYPVMVLLDSEERCYGIICEAVEAEKYDEAFQKAAELFNNLYFYKDASANSYFANGKVHYFYVDDVCSLLFAKCDNGKKSLDLCQRYLAAPVTDIDIVQMASLFVSGELKEPAEGHALRLVQFVVDRFNSKPQPEDSELCECLSDFYWGMRDYEKCLVWMETAAQLGSQVEAYNCGNTYNGRITEFDCPVNREKALDYYLQVISGSDDALRDEAEDQIVSIWYYYADELPEDRLQELEETVIRICRVKDDYISEVYERLGDKL